MPENTVVINIVVSKESKKSLKKLKQDLKELNALAGSLRKKISKLKLDVNLSAKALRRGRNAR